MNLLTKETNVHHGLFISQCKTPELGIIVFTSTIINIEFKILNYPSELINNEYDPQNKQYILCVQPTEGRKYQIQITHEKFKGEICIVQNIKSSEAQYFKIESKNESIALKLEEEEKKRIQAESNYIKVIKKYNDNNLTLGIGNGVNCGDLGVYSRFRFGGIVGAGIEGGVGFSDFDSKLMHWSAGVKFYPYKYWALSAHCGTLSTEKTDTYNTETGEFGIGGVKQHKGWSILGGYDGIVFNLIHINTGIGFSSTDHISFTWNIGIGFSLTGLFLKL